MNVCSFNPWITKQKLPNFTEMGTFCTHIFYIVFANFFPTKRLTDWIEVKTVILFGFYNRHPII
jgi:hypothetical protein